MHILVTSIKCILPVTVTRATTYGISPMSEAKKFILREAATGDTEGTAGTATIGGRAGAGVRRGGCDAGPAESC